MYTTRNFKTKKELKEAIAAHLADPIFVVPVRLYAPGLGTPNDNGRETVEGPHYPQLHKWYAQVKVKDGIVISVK